MATNEAKRVIWRTAQYGDSRTLDLGIVSVRVYKRGMNLTDDAKGYTVTAYGAKEYTLPERIPDLVEAKTAGIRLARRVLKEAIARLESFEAVNGETSEN